eukprot:Nk52_evm31s212 gene=Nk52_evmTU31s212
MPPVRNSHLLVKKKKKKKDEEEEKEKEKEKKQEERIKSYDYRSWDKYDVDEEVKKIDLETKQEEEEEEEYEELSEGEIAHLERQRNIQISLLEKDKGNLLLKEGKYRDAVAAYTRGIEADASNHLLFSNRAMAYLKSKHWKDAESDAGHAISLNQRYCKSWHRRATARTHQRDYYGAMSDLKEALRLEPANKQLMHDYMNVNKLMCGDNNNNNNNNNNEKKKEEEEKRKSGEGKGVVVDGKIRGIGETDGGNKGFVVEVKKENRNNIKSGGVKNTFKRILIQEINTGEVEEEEEEEEEKGVEKEREEEPLSSSEAVKDNVKRVESPVGSLAVPEMPELPPKTSFEFEKNWKQLSNHPAMLYKFFRSIRPDTYAKLFQQCFTADIFLRIVGILERNYVGEGEEKEDGDNLEEDEMKPSPELAVKVLENLCQVRRFDMTMMFLNRGDKAKVQSLFDKLASCTGDGVDASPVQVTGELAKKYGVKIR